MSRLIKTIADSNSRLAQPGGRPGGVHRRTVLTGIGATIFSPAVLAQGTLRKLSVPTSSTSFATASLRSAIDLGCFKENGLDITMPIMETGSNVTAALISGSVDVILGGPGELIAAQGRGQPVILLTNCYWGQSGTLIVAKDVIDKSGVSRTATLAERLKVLEGIPIATPSATSALTASFRGAADALGIKLSFVYMGQPSMVSALEAGAVRAYVASAPIWGTTVTRNQGVDWVSAPRGELPDANVPRGATGLNSMRAFADANPEMMKQILDSYRAFSDILVKTPDRVRESLARLYPTVDAASLDVLFAAEKGAWVMRDVTTADMQHEIDFVKASGAPLTGLDSIDPASTFYVPKA